MKIFLISVALLIMQMMNTQQKQVIHLRPNQPVIGTDAGGKLLELINAPPIVALPAPLPKQDAAGNPWTIDIKNLGPRTVIISGKNQFSAPINVGQTLHIYATATGYIVKH